ncbi:MAG: WD40 repeat domain-containing protein, partial [Nitrospirota bacterium]
PLYTIPTNNKISATALNDKYFAVATNYGHIKYCKQKNGDVKIYKTGSWNEILMIDSNHIALDVNFSPDGNYFAIGTGRCEISYSAGNRIPDKVHIYETATWKEVMTLETGKSNELVSFSPDNRFLFVSDGKDIAIFDTTTNTKLKDMDVISDSSYGSREIAIISFSPDGRHLVIGASEPSNMSGEVLIYKYGTWQKIWQNRFLGAVSSINFSADNKYLNIRIGGFQQEWQTFRLGDFQLEKKEKNDIYSIRSIFDNHYSVRNGDRRSEIVDEKSHGRLVQKIDNFFTAAFNKQWLIGYRNNKINCLGIEHLYLYYLKQAINHIGFNNQSDALAVSAQEIETDFQNRLKVIQTEQTDGIAKQGSTKKDEFETEAEYKSRMSTRDSKIKEINQTYEDKRLTLRRERTSKRIALIDEYEKILDELLAKTRKPITDLTVSLGDYIADAEIFPVSITENGAEFFTATVRVPRDEAKGFKGRSDKLQLTGDTQLDRTGKIKLINSAIKDLETGKEYPVTNPTFTGLTF